MMIYGTPEFVVQTLRIYIMRFYIGNAACENPRAVGYSEEHQRFDFPCGSNDRPQVMEFLRTLKTEDFFNPEAPHALSFEVKPWQNKVSGIVTDNAAKTPNNALALLEN